MFQCPNTLIHFPFEEPAFVECHTDDKPQCIFIDKGHFRSVGLRILCCHAQHGAGTRYRKTKTGRYSKFLCGTFTFYLIVRKRIIGSQTIFDMSEVATPYQIRDVFSSYSDTHSGTKRICIVHVAYFVPFLQQEVGSHRQTFVIYISQASTDRQRNTISCHTVARV